MLMDESKCKVSGESKRNTKKVTQEITNPICGVRSHLGRTFCWVELKTHSFKSVEHQGQKRLLEWLKMLSI